MVGRGMVVAVAGGIAMTAGALWAIPTASDDADVPAPHRGVVDVYGDLPLAFEANRGQVDDRVRFLTRGNGYALYLERAGATFALSRPSEPGIVEPTTPGAGIAMRLAGSEAPTGPEGRSPLPGVVNYLKGSDPAGWRTGIPTYGAVRYEGVYPGTDLVFRGGSGRLEYDFVLAPGADPADIRLRFEGADGLRLGSGGELVVGTPAGDLRHAPPAVFQMVDGERVGVPGGYALDGRTVGFEVGAYDPSLPLVIDPVVMVYSTFLGGGATDNPFDIAVDSKGAAYVAGYTADAATDYPATPGAFDQSHNGFDDAFMTKIAPDGASLAYSTFLGGTGDDYAFDVAVDGAGAAYASGNTAGSGFPTTPGAFDESFNGGRDAFVTKLAPNGGSLTYSTFLGGDMSDIGFGLAVDAAGSAFVTGETNDGTTDYPTTPGAFDADHNGGRDAFATKLAPGGGSLVYSTFLGGSASDQGIRIAVDGSGSAFLTGRTFNAVTDYPTTPGAFDDTHNGSDDAFVTKLAPDGGSLAYSTFLGGVLDDAGYSIATDDAGSAYVTGNTNDGATDYPTTPGAFDTMHNGSYDAFVTKVAPDGATLAYSTFLGGGNFDGGRGIVVVEGSAYVAGRAADATTDYPTTPGAFDTTQNGGDDAVLTLLDPSGASLEYSTFLGGDGGDVGWGVAVDRVGAMYVTGETFDAPTTEYPTTLGAFDTTHNGVNDGFVTKLAEPGTCKGKAVTILGTLSADALTGTSGPDVFSGLDGQDVLKGLGGKDTICGGDANDSANGGGGNDTASGGTGGDTIKGGAGKDKLFGDQGKDRLAGGGGNDKMNGGKGKDTCRGGSGRDKAPKCEKERSVP